MSTLLDHPVPTLPPPPPRERRRIRLPRWSQRTYLTIGVIAGIVFAVGLWLFYFSSVFALESLVVEGVRTVNPTEVGQRADLGAGTPLARVNPQDVEDRVLGIPGVDSVQVTRRWPHTIVISVVERNRVATIKDGERWATLDAKGFAFATTKKKPQGLPVVEAPEGQARTAAVQVAAVLPPEVIKRISTITAETPENVILTTSSGATVVWGPATDNDLKMQVLRALLTKSKDKWFDLRIPMSPTSAQSSPKPAPPPSPSPSPSLTPGADPEGSPVPVASGAVPVVPGIVPSSITPVVP